MLPPDETRCHHVMHARCFDPQEIIQRQKRHRIGYIMPKKPYHRTASMSDVLTGNGKVSINFTVCSHIPKDACTKCNMRDFGKG